LLVHDPTARHFHAFLHGNIPLEIFAPSTGRDSCSAIQGIIVRISRNQILHSAITKWAVA
jgi:hypothetical protein